MKEGDKVGGLVESVGREGVSVSSSDRPDCFFVFIKKRHWGMEWEGIITSGGGPYGLSIDRFLVLKTI